MAKDEKRSLRLSMEDLNAMTPHQLSEIVSAIVLLLRRLPNVPMNRLSEVQALSNAPQDAQDEPYSATASDEALYGTLLTSKVLLAIQQEYANGNITNLDAYNRLYAVARDADTQARVLLGRLEKDGAES